MNSNKSKKEIKPDRQSWLISGISVASLVLFNSIAVIELEKFRKHIKIAELEESYYSASDQNIPVISDLINAAKKRAPASFFGGDSLNPQLEILKNLELSLINYDSEASLKYASLLKHSQNENANSATEYLDAHIKILADLNIKKHEIILERKQLLNAEHKQETEYLKLKNEMLLFFGLSEDVTDKEIVFYQSGVLQGLPRLSSIPDGIEDLQTFSDRLTAAGGQINIESENPQQVFQERLSSFSDIAFNIMIKKDSESQNIELLNEKLQLYDQNYSAELNLTLRFLKEVALKIVKNQPFFS